MSKRRSGVATQRARAPDVARAAAAVSRPGIDPRVWYTEAIVTERGFDPEEGLFVDVKFIPDGTPETCYLATSYAGAGFGFHKPVRVGDVVLVAIPMGDEGNGPRVVSTNHNAAAPPNAELEGENGEFTDDVVLRIEPGQKLIIRTSGEGDAVDISVEGGGDAIVAVADGGQIRLGDANVTSPAQGVVQGEGIDSFTGTTFAAQGNASQIVGAKKQ